jgi:RHS repeat-associated protein
MHSERKYYAGHRRHDDTGLVYMKARWYDPGSGTFLSVDPVVAGAGDPQAYNAYAYARNNPINLTDPTGMCPAALMGGGRCEGKWYGYTSSIQGYQAASAEVVDPGSLADYGWKPGSVAANLGAFDSYPSLGEFFSGLNDFFTPESQSSGGFWSNVGEYFRNATVGVGGMLIGGPLQVLLGVGSVLYGLGRMAYGLATGDGKMFVSGLARFGLGLGYLLAAPLPKYGGSTGVLWPGPDLGSISWLQATNFDKESAWHDQQPGILTRSAPQFGWIDRSLRGADGHVDARDILGVDPYGQAVRALGVVLFGAYGAAQLGVETALQRGGN